jgi:hypothetical protein
MMEMGDRHPDNPQPVPHVTPKNMNFSALQEQLEAVSEVSESNFSSQRPSKLKAEQQISLLPKDLGQLEYSMQSSQDNQLIRSFRSSTNSSHMVIINT